MRKLSFVLLAVVLLVASCTTLNPHILPAWVTVKPVVNDYVTFIGEGSGSSAAEARTASYRDVLSKMSSEIGYDLYDLYYREFSANKVISAIGITINDEYSYASNGVYFHYVYTITSEKSFYEARSAEYIALLDRESRIQKLLDGAIEEYRQNRDVGAAEKVLEALLVSLEGEVSKEDFQPGALVDKAVEYLGRIRIKNVKNKRHVTADSLSFRVVRNKGFVKPVVEDAVFLCEYQAIKSDFSIGRSTTMGRTDRYGRFVFNWTNTFAKHVGELKVSVKLDQDLLYRITLAGGDNLMGPVHQVIEDTSFSISYEKPERRDISSVLIAVAEYGFDGNAKNQTELESAILSAFQKVEATCPDIITVLSDEGSEIEEDLLSRYGEKSCIILCRTGISDRALTANRYFSKADGQLVVLTPSTGEREETSDIHFSVGGENERAADEATLKAIAEITAGLVLAEF